MIGSVTDTINPDHLIRTFGTIGLFLIIFAESGLLIGFFLPGDSLLFTAGLFAARGDLNIVVILIGCFLAAVLGDQVGYDFVQVHDFVAQEGSYYLVMEWVEGIDLGHFIREHRNASIHVEWPLAVAIGIGTLRGLGAAHDRHGPDGTPSPVIHRDVTPHNVLLGVNGVVKLTDFGLARARDRVASMTAPGTVKGKLSYLAPEVSFGKANTPQSDLFGVGSVLWETLSGERLFDGKTDVEIFKKIRACKVPPIAERRPDIPASLAAVLDVALDADPANRFTSATAFAQALSQVMKQAVGIDPQTALGAAVRELRARAKGEVEIDVNSGSLYEVSRADADAEPIPLTKPKPRG